jgi:uncharacterized protein YbjQ (UPF0145 family)
LIVSTTPSVPGRKIVETLGLVRGSTVRGKHLGLDLIAFFRNLVGGEIAEYSKMLAESREQALDRMMEDAAKLGADAIVSVRYSTSSITSGAAEILIYGTAVRLAEKPE